MRPPAGVLFCDTVVHKHYSRCVGVRLNEVCGHTLFERLDTIHVYSVVPLA